MKLEEEVGVGVVDVRYVLLPNSCVPFPWLVLCRVELLLAALCLPRSSGSFLHSRAQWPSFPHLAHLDLLIRVVLDHFLGLEDWNFLKFEDFFDFQVFPCFPFHVFPDVGGGEGV